MTKPVTAMKQLDMKLDPKFEMKLCHVTPAMAEKWLKKNHPRNREMNWNTLTALENDLRSGHWRRTHQGICFDGDGFLIDGQHRLRAIVNSGITAELLVCTNSDAELHDPIDRGRTRTVAFVTGLHPRLSGALGLLRRMETGIVRSTVPVTVAEILETAEHHRESIQAVDDCVNIVKKCSMVSGLRAAIIWCMPIHAERALEFAAKVSTGEMIARGDPAFAFRSWRERMMKASPYNMLFASLNCLRHAMQGKSLTSVYTGESGYRASVAKRRAMHVPHTPGVELVEGMSWGNIRLPLKSDETE